MTLMTLKGAESRSSYTGLCALAVLVGWMFATLVSRAKRQAVAVVVFAHSFKEDTLRLVHKPASARARVGDSS